MKTIRNIVISTSEPPVHNVAWLQPQSNNTYKLFIYGNNGWTRSGGGTTADIPLATQSKAGLMSADDKSKLDGIASGANKYTHPSYTAKSSGLYKVTVDSTGHVSAATAVTKSDITALGIPGQDTNTTYNDATQSAHGLMTAADKKKLDGIASGANAYSHPTATAYASGLYKITTNNLGHVTSATAVTKSDITALGIPGQDTNTTYNEATTSSAGLMSAEDKTKLDNLVVLTQEEYNALEVKAENTIYFIKS